ncbi:hypothetical protein DSM104299_05779 [Baekduia alba]|uniref:hypothetical protein n=1 Tax=Baekduia alba TaxID=2997333 RepID=UPI00234016E4|nr:hypothetical protein [Baekduia alba]WCB97009.1 hypothetical protein DSM104299_05779 [Baekduia alba]
MTGATTITDPSGSVTVESFEHRPPVAVTRGAASVTESQTHLAYDDNYNMDKETVGITVILSGPTSLVALDDGLVADLQDDERPRRIRDRREIVVGVAVRAGIFALSIVIAYAISESLAKWSWLLLLGTGFVERRARATR